MASRNTGLAVTVSAFGLLVEKPTCESFAALVPNQCSTNLVYCPWMERSVGGDVRQDVARHQIDVIWSAGHGIQVQQHLEVLDGTRRCDAAFAQFSR
jgi:hypothetical protein